MKQKAIHITRAASVSVEDIADELRNAPYDFLLDLIKHIDRAQEDWGFTEQVFSYFQEEMKKLPADEAAQ